MASARHLPFGPAVFDFAAAFMSLMDMPDARAALREAYRVVRPGGFLQFSITHPFFDMPHRRQLRDEAGRPVAFEMGGYFDPPPAAIGQWIFSSLPEERRRELPPFRIPRFRRTLAEWLNALCKTGFVLERAAEPHAGEETTRRVPHAAGTRVIPYFLHLRARKPAA